MDNLFNKGKEMLSKSGNSSTGTGTQQPPQNTGNAGQEDYGDKGLDFLEKKTGHTLGRDQNERITDGARGLYEKETGNQVNPKYSN